MSVNVCTIFGPPGTGKTTTLVGIAEHEVAAHHKALYLSYTKAAAVEATSRLGTNRVEASTLHSLAYRFLNVQRSQVITRDKLQAFADITGVPFRGADMNTMDETQEGDEYVAVISYAAARRMDVHEAYDHMGRPGTIGRFEMFEEAYRKWKSEYGLIDFDDMLLRFAESRGTAPTAPVVILDEAQDCSPLHWEVFSKIAAGAKRVYVAGDDDQAIYEWNGADPHGMAKYSADHGGVIDVLSQSYRVPIRVHSLVHGRLLDQFCNRVPKVFEPTSRTGFVDRYGSAYDFDFRRLRGKDAKILVRDRFAGLAIQRILNAELIPYKMAGGWSPFYNKKANAIRAINKLNRGEQPTDAEMRAMMDTVKNLGAHPESAVIGKRWQDLVPLGKGDRDFYEHADLDEPLTIELSTIHQAKGKEADYVVLDLTVTGATERNFEKDRDAEMRVWYVGCTRTSNILALLGDNPLMS